MGIFSEAFEERVAELETEVQQLKAELRQYQPSDGMMYKLLGLNEVIREAARLMREALGAQPGQPPPWDRMAEWMLHPIVQRALKSALPPVKP